LSKVPKVGVILLKDQLALLVKLFQIGTRILLSLLFDGINFIILRERAFLNIEYNSSWLKNEHPCISYCRRILQLVQTNLLRKKLLVFLVYLLLKFFSLLGGFKERIFLKLQ
jgi:hypothetical protein